MAARSKPFLTRARLFDADRSDTEIEISSTTVGAITDRQLLWLDVNLGGDPADRQALLAVLPFDTEVLERMWASASGPRLLVHGTYFLARVVLLRPYAHSDASKELSDDRVVLDLVVGKNVVITAHPRPVAFLADLDERIRGDTTVGEIDSAEFASVLLDGVVTSYLEHADTILGDVDTLDGRALESTGHRGFLADLVALRHRIAAVRRMLVAHRTVIAGMTGPDFQAITGTKAAPPFAALTARFNGAVDAIDTAREALLGTFDIHMSRTAQRTNAAMQTLTIASVLLLPTGVIAGFMGMNIRAPYSMDNPWTFWVVVGLIVIVAAATIMVTRRRDWL